MGIPDRFGFFSPDPPPLQEFQGATVAFLLFALVSITFWSVLLVLLIKARGRPILGVIGMIVGMILAFVGMVWILGCCDRRCAPDDDWGDWKLEE